MAHSKRGDGAWRAQKIKQTERETNGGRETRNVPEVRYAEDKKYIRGNVGTQKMAVDWRKAPTSACWWYWKYFTVAPFNFPAVHFYLRSVVVASCKRVV